jgi:hypothetical protein
MKVRHAVTLAVFCLVPSTASYAGPQQDSQACISDALTVCAAFIPDRDRVAGCLISNRNRVSLACREALKHFNPRTASP